MNPSSLSTCATLLLSAESGMSTAGRSIRLALRMRVNMSESGSVIMARSPACLRNSRDQTVAGHVAKTDAAQPKLAIDSPRPAAQPAPHPDPDPVAWPQLGFGRITLGQIALRQLFLELGFL